MSVSCVADSLDGPIAHVEPLLQHLLHQGICDSDTAINFHIMPDLGGSEDRLLHHQTLQSTPFDGCLLGLQLILPSPDLLEELPVGLRTLDEVTYGRVLDSI